MGRKAPKPAGKIGLALHGAMVELGVSPLEAAAAANIHKGTLYKILSGETTDPHHSTLRKLCRVLELDLAALVGAEQLDLLEASIKAKKEDTDLQPLLTDEITGLPEDMWADGTKAVLLAFITTTVGVGDEADQAPLRDIRGRQKVSRTYIAKAISKQLETTPFVARHAATRSALAALIDMKLLAVTPSPDAYRAISHLRTRVWQGVDKPKRSPLRAAGASAPKKIGTPAA